MAVGLTERPLLVGKCRSHTLESTGDADFTNRAMAESTLIDALISDKWKDLLGRQLSTDPKEQSAANRELQTAINESHAGKSKDLWLSQKDVPQLLQIALTM